MNNSERQEHAFTLVEILVVIAMVTVLIALLVPSLFRARENSYRISCAANMKQVGHAILMYVNDNKGALPKPSKVAADPSDAIWWQPSRIKDVGAYGLGPYLRLTPTDLRIFRCTSDEQADTRKDAGKYPYTFSFNDNMGGDGIAAVKRIGQVRVPSDKIIVFEENGPTLDDASARMWNVHGSWTGIGLLGLRHDRQHRTVYPDTSSATQGVPNGQGRGNVLFTDWHVDYIHRIEAQSKHRVLPDAGVYPNEPEVGP